MITQTKIGKFVLLLTLALSQGAMTSHVIASLIPLSQTNSYSQNFDSLPSSGSAKFLLPGWAIKQFGNVDSQITADDGNQTLGGVYSYGPTGSPNRAIGTLTDADRNRGIFGANFQNAGADPIMALNVSYTGEEWRLGVAGHANTLEFQYSLNAKSLFDPSATWLNVPALSFLTPNLIGVGAHDGTLAVNQTQIASTISFLNIPRGGTFWIRWQEVGVDHGSNGDGLAVDDFSISVVPEASTLLAAVGALGLVAGTVWRPHWLRPKPHTAA